MDPLDDISSYDYDLPQDRIALHPATPRDSCKLMVLDRSRDGVLHRRFDRLPDLLREGDLLVANDSKVIPARLKGRRADTGGSVECLLLEEIQPDLWLCLAKPGKRCRTGQILDFGQAKASVEEEREDGQRLLRFLPPWTGHTAMEAFGEIPLPPYIQRPVEPADSTDYQTLYASPLGSIAAPTAGLHFTDSLLSTLRSKGIGFTQLTLHVGVGTFRPIRSDHLHEHRMDAERCVMSANTAAILNEAKREKRRIIAVGTTAVRALEANALLDGTCHPGEWKTDLFIRPGHTFRMVDGLITNFHLPRSTLLALVSALAGRDRVFEAYEEAKREGYRFYSFGDAMLIL